MLRKTNLSHGSRSRRRRVIGAVVGVLALAACKELTQQQPTLGHLGPVGQQSFTCTVDVKAQQTRCNDVAASASSSVATATSPRLRADRIVGGQDTYVQLASSGTSYDGGTEVLSSNVTIQNLMQTLIGTTDGTTVSGVSVFLASGPDVISGSGTVTVANPDGTGTFTSSNQPYFQYAEILEPYQISASHQWQFSVPNTVVTFQFIVYVSVPMVDPSAPLVGQVWTGTQSTLWSTTGNWKNDSVPSDSSVVAIPRASLLASGANQPTLTANDTVSDLRVGEGSTLTLGGFQLDVRRNLDAAGTITGGTVRVTGDSSLIGGTLSSLEITGSAFLQRAVKTDGAVSVTGSLSVQNTSLTIAIP